MGVENGYIVMRRAEDTRMRPGEDVPVFVARLRAEQGLPEEIDDPVVLDKLAALLS